MNHLLLGSVPDDHRSENEVIKQRPIGEIGSPVYDTAILQQRRQRLDELEADLEAARESLINDLGKELRASQQKLAQSREQCNNIKYEQIRSSNRVHSLEAKIQDVTRIVGRHHYISVLIDGNAFSFTTDLLSEGETGGQRAGERLLALVDDHVTKQLLLKYDLKIQVQLYANLAEVKKKLLAAGQIDNTDVFDQFVRGFNRGSPLFDIIDAGEQQNGIEFKLKDSILLQIYNCHCQHVILGVPDVEPYISLLDNAAGEGKMSERITLLEHQHPYGATGALPQVYGRLKCRGIFGGLEVSRPRTSEQPTNIGATVSAPVTAQVLTMAPVRTMAVCHETTQFLAITPVRTIVSYHDVVPVSTRAPVPVAVPVLLTAPRRT